MPASHTQTLDLAFAHHSAGRLDAAESLYAQILAADPAHGETLYLFGTLAAQRRQYLRAEDFFRRALAAGLDQPELHTNLAHVCIQTYRYPEAAAAAARAVALRPNYPEAHNNLSIALYGLGRIPEAVAAAERAVALNPNFVDAHNALAIALRGAGRFNAASAAARRAIALNPNDANAHNSLAASLHALGDYPAARAAASRSLALDPACAEAHNTLGSILRSQVDLPAAAEAFRRAIALAPNFADAHFNLGALLLLKGDFPAALPEFEWRLRSSLAPDPRPFAAPAWQGEPLAGQTLFLHAEQGFGDSLQFIRYLPLIAAAAPSARLILEAPPRLIPLLRQFHGVSALITREDPRPHYDFHCSLMSLPFVFRTTLDTIPASIPYLAADPEKLQHWRARLAPLSFLNSQSSALPLRVGLAWSGNPQHKEDHLRSIPLAQFLPLAEVPNAQFYSLQLGEAAAQTRSAPFPIVDLTAHLHDFSDTAALVAALDLVISVDTAVVHLAGAMGKPVWVALQYLPDYRWLLARPDSPWYPTMRLFRQSDDRSYDSVLAKIAEALHLATKPMKR